VVRFTPVQINRSNQVLKEKSALRFLEAEKLVTSVCLLCANPSLKFLGALLVTAIFIVDTAQNTIVSSTHH